MTTPLQRYFIEISYNGTAYHGWQIQLNAVSVQEKLNVALNTILRQNIETIGAGRTDTGVHAKQMYVHFDATLNETDVVSGRLVHAINALLPSDIAVKRIIKVEQKSHARFDATSRSYEYHIHFKKDPFLENFSWQMRDVPDIHKMNEAAQFLIGKQDFSCFSKSNTQVFTNICDVQKAVWETSQGRLTFHITADRFLRNMVRAIVGTLIEIGNKKQEIDHMQRVIESKNRSVAGTSVPACGLYLTNIKYPYID